MFRIIWNIYLYYVISWFLNVFILWRIKIFNCRDNEYEDRINEQILQYVYIDDNWWHETKQIIYTKKFESYTSTTNITRNRLTFPQLSDLTYESISIDISGEKK